MKGELSGEQLAFSTGDMAMHASLQDTKMAFTHDNLSQATTPDCLVSLNNVQIEYIVISSLGSSCSSSQIVCIWATQQV